MSSARKVRKAGYGIAVLAGLAALVPIFYRCYPTSELLEKFTAPGFQHKDEAIRELFKLVDGLSGIFAGFSILMAVTAWVILRNTKDEQNEK